MHTSFKVTLMSILCGVVFASCGGEEEEEIVEPSRSCLLDGDCKALGTDYICRNLECVRDEEPVDPCNACTSQQDCVQGQCVQKCSSVQYRNDKGVCTNYECVAGIVPCPQEGQECNKYHECVDIVGYCSDAIPCEDTRDKCDLDLKRCSHKDCDNNLPNMNCSEGYICKDYTCEKDPTYCNENTPPQEGKFCLDHKFQLPIVGSYCSKETDECGDDYECKSGRCILKTADPLVLIVQTTTEKAEYTRTAN